MAYVLVKEGWQHWKAMELWPCLPQKPPANSSPVWAQEMVGFPFPMKSKRVTPTWLEYTLQQWSLAILGSWIPMRTDESYGSYLQKEKREAIETISMFLWTPGCQPMDSDLRSTAFHFFFSCEKMCRNSIRYWPGAKEMMGILRCDWVYVRRDILGGGM